MRRAVDQPLGNEPDGWFVDIRLRAAIRAGGVSRLIAARFFAGPTTLALSAT